MNSIGFLLFFYMRFFCLLFVLIMMDTVVFAAGDHPPIIGYWLTRKHDTQEPSSVVELFVDADQKLVGRVVAGFYDASQSIPERTCRRCSPRTVDGRYGLKQGQDIVGSYAVWGFMKRRDDLWYNGKVVRIKTGSVYRSNMRLRDHDWIDLTVRYGIFYQTLSWQRLSSSQYTRICAGDLSSITSNKNFKALCIS